MKRTRNTMLLRLLKDLSSVAAAARSTPGRNDTAQLGQEAKSTKQRHRQSGQCVRLKVSSFTELSRAGRVVRDQVTAPVQAGERCFHQPEVRFARAVRRPGHRSRAIDDSENLVLAHDQQLLAVYLDFGTAVLAEQDAVAGLHVQRLTLAVLQIFAVMACLALLVGLPPVKECDSWIR